jgi:hypothetical protein
MVWTTPAKGWWGGGGVEVSSCWMWQGRGGGEGTSSVPEESAAASKKEGEGGGAGWGADDGSEGEGGEGGREHVDQASARISAAGVGSSAIRVQAAVCSLKDHSCTQAQPAAWGAMR